MARRNSDVDVREHKKQRSAAEQAQHMGTNSPEKSDADVRKLGETVTSSAGEADVDTGEPYEGPKSASPQGNSYPSRDHNSNQSEETPTMQDLVDEVHRCILDHGSADVADAFISASEQPPITLESLAELEIPRIINNPKLRHDVNFDRELHFRPNLDGPRGQQKMKQTEDYWKALVGEISMYAHVQKELLGATTAQKEAYWSKIRAESEKRLPNVLTAIKDIIYTLVPEYDQDVVKERLDSKFMMQEIKNGVCDLVGLADWLAKMLKSHCAPMRDAMVDRMRAEIVQGATDGRAETLVNGIRQLLSVLEAMKLDVANHQIRHMRPILVADTVHFSHRYNAHRIATDRIDVVRSRNWLDFEMETMIRDGQSPTHLEALTSALLRGLLLNIDYKNMYPQTFYLDGERLKHISHELHMGVFQQVCRDILQDMTLSHPPAAFERAAATLKEKVTAITGATYKFLERIEYIAAEIMRIVLEMEGKAGCTDIDLMADVERRLDVDLCNPNSVVYEHLGLQAIARILPKLQASVAKHIRMSAVTLQDTLVPQPAAPPAPPLGFGARLVPATPTPQPVDEDEDVVRRLTHIIVLHWQVWAELVYLAHPGDEGDSASSNGGPSPPSSRSVSPTVPMAEAVYEPGHKFLPTGLTVTDVPSRRPSPANSSVSDDADPPPSTSNHEQNDAQSKRRTIDPEQ